MADQLEISIPITLAEVTELQTICEALGTPLEAFLTDTVASAISAHRQRYQGHLSRMAAMVAANEKKGVRIINPATREKLTFSSSPVEVEVTKEKLK